MSYSVESYVSLDVSLSYREFLRKIASLPILTEDQEKELAEKWVTSGDKKAAQKLVSHHLKLVVKFANLYKNRGCSVTLMDLISEGALGLVEAIKKFDPKRGYRFATYAMHYVKAKMQGLVMSSFSIVKLSCAKTTKKLFAKYKEVINAESDEKIQEIAKAASTSEENVKEIKYRLQNKELSLNEARYSGELQDIIEYEVDNQETLALEYDEKSKVLRAMHYACANFLNQRERDIIAARILTEKPAKLKDLAQKYAVSAEYVRQIQVSALNKIKNHLINVGLA